MNNIEKIKGLVKEIQNLFFKNNYSAVINETKKAIKVYPDISVFYNMMGLAFSKISKFDEAKIVKQILLSNYVGLGPYRSSKTKFDLNSFLTPEEIKRIVDFLNPIPVFLIGGIDLDQCSLISDFNLSGLAVCSSLSSAELYGAHVKRFINQIAEITHVSI